ncbi:MAG: methionyl-tRNA formyltransferase [Armatimonadota bacterium]
MGTPATAAKHLAVAAESAFRVVGVVTQPDRPKGRGRKLTPPPVKLKAQELGLPVFQPERASSREFVERLEQLAPALYIVVAYGEILKPEVLAIPPLGAINVHFSLLPELRGAAPVFWAIRRGYRETGVTTMYLAEEMDAGDVILAQEEPVLPEDTTGTLEARLAERGCELLAETLRLIAAGEAPREPQDHERATYAPLVKKSDGHIDWSAAADEIERLVRACQPWPGAATTCGGRPLKVVKACAATNFSGRGGQPGELVELTKDAGLVVAAGTGALRVVEVQPAGGRVMRADAFARGARLSAGDCLGA